MGTLIAVYAGLGLGEQVLKADVQAIVTNKPGMLNLAVGAGVLLGVLVQGKFDTWKANTGDRRKSKVMKTLSDAEKDALKGVKARGPLLRLILPKKAG